MGALQYCIGVVLVGVAVFELPHHLPRASLLPCRKAELTDPGLCVASPLPTSLLQLAQGVEPELEYFTCSELQRSLPCTLPNRREHAGRNCFNKRPKGTLLRPVSASGGSGPGGREWDWQPKVGEYIDGDAEDGEDQLTFSVVGGETGQRPGEKTYRWIRVPTWASLWHKPWAKVKLMMGNEDGGSSELEVKRSSVG